jgi:hypothetical protein
VAYADGRITHHEGGPRGGGFWTPMFPRESTALEPGGLPVTAVKCDWKREGDHLQVAVSVLRGEPHQQELPVSTHAVGLGQRITVEALRAFGVRPIVLSAKPIGPVASFQPRVLNKTAGLEVTNVEVVTEPIPGYLISVTNLSTKSAVSFSVESFQGERRSTSGRQGDPEGNPIIQPGKTHTFRWRMSSGAPASAGAWAPAPIDLIAITSVLWDDGTFEGDREPAVSAQILNGARRLQLARVVAMLRATARESMTPEQLMPRLRAQAETLPILASDADVAAVSVFDPQGEARTTKSLEGTVAVAFQQVKKTLIDDLRAAESKRAGSSPAMAQAFMQEILGHYEAWLSRVSP